MLELLYNKIMFMSKEVSLANVKHLYTNKK